jgi:hypothetical protein
MGKIAKKKRKREGKRKVGVPALAAETRAKYSTSAVSAQLWSLVFASTKERERERRKEREEKRGTCFGSGNQSEIQYISSLRADVVLGLRVGEFVGFLDELCAQQALVLEQALGVRACRCIGFACFLRSGQEVI